MNTDGHGFGIYHRATENHREHRETQRQENGTADERGWTWKPGDLPAKSGTVPVS